MLKHLTAGQLEVAYEEHGSTDALPIILLHGFPYDVRAFDGVVALLNSGKFRLIVPYLRGFGPTRFLSPGTMRSGQQAALGHDLLSLMDALGIDSAIVAGYDWGGRAACIAAALWPSRVKGLVTVGGYNIQDIAGSSKPLSPDLEQRLWYQYYFHSERGRSGLAANRSALCNLLWRLWSPPWNFDQSTFDATAASFENPDFVDVVIHSYRHRFGLVAGDETFAQTEVLLASRPKINVPTVSLEGESDGVTPPGRIDANRHLFGDQYARRLLPGVGHNVPQEAPKEFADAILSLVPN
jgi:pimeloyl-ACP methyl ester carboxylesterase